MKLDKEEMENKVMEYVESLHDITVAFGAMNKELEDDPQFPGIVVGGLMTFMTATISVGISCTHKDAKDSLLETIRAVFNENMDIIKERIRTH